jgi:ubiquinone/menaquinone biosynthesis C-methylase UbiE
VSPEESSWTSDVGVRREYVNSSNMTARISFYRRYGSRGGTWYEWLFEHLPIKDGQAVLDIGCGACTLWLRNLERMPMRMQLILGDASPAMVANISPQLRSYACLRGAAVMRVEALPITSETFDVAIAAHMLYHVNDIASALQELHRILKPGGVVVATTVGEEHLAGVGRLLTRFSGDFSGVELAPRNLSPEKLARLVSHYFDGVSVVPWRETLVVSDASALVDFLMASHLRDRLEWYKGQLVEFLQGLISAEGPISLLTESDIVAGQKSS